MNILVIDDYTETTTILSKFLKNKGFEIEVTNDPMIGVNKIRHKQYDVILLEITIPVISGIGVIELLATDGILKDQNIFIFSETSTPNIQVKNILRRDGVNGFLKKPIELDKLFTAITS